MRHEQRFTIEKIKHFISRLERFVYRQREPLPPFRIQELESPEIDPPVAPGYDDSKWPVIEPETHWGRRGMNFILRGSFVVPTDWSAGRTAALYLPIGDAGDFSHPEALVYIDGEPYAASDRHHQEIILPEDFLDGREHSLALHGWTGIAGELAVFPRKSGLFMNQCEVVMIDTALRDFIALARVGVETAATLDRDNPVRYRLLNALDDAFVHATFRDPASNLSYDEVPEACEILRAGIGKAGSPLDVTVVATGHSHIDVAWLWTLGQTRRKVGRTFHTVLRLMEQFPDYHFTQSQPQLYAYVKQDYPELYEAIRERVREGRWEVTGGMWVEADCNLSGPESLARQFILGRRFFREEFGPDAESPVLWLPDVFGYSWSIPQLIRLAGLEYFFTIKISWNQYNRLPYDTFWWQGIDGTKVLTHFSTAPDINPNPLETHMSTYNAKAIPEQVLGTWRNFQQKELGQELLMAFGFGDGGGGPTREMLENIREMTSFPGMPKMKQKPVGDFYRELEKDWGDRLPVWNGELYFELHRGTYTSQARNKRANRKSEFLLHDAELFATWARTLDTGFEYPSASIRRAWELLCLNQFHDIIPGSSIAEVYEESLAQYDDVREICESVMADSLERIGAASAADMLVVNPVAYPRRGPVYCAGEADTRTLVRSDGSPVMTQVVDGGVLLDLGEVPPMGYAALRYGDDSPVTADTGLAAGERFLENEFVRVEISDTGDITRIYDKQAGREVLPDGSAANVFQAFEDKPLEWDAWDVFIYYDDVSYAAEPAESIRLVENGPLRATFAIERRILESTYTQRISLTHLSPRIDVTTDIFWRQREMLLKAAFPVDVLSPEATYEIQWGNVSRPTHRNTSWDWARFETCAQKWVDLSEGGYGVSILNDCKYGHDIRDNVIRITLLRAPESPASGADYGAHTFAYSILPHRGSWDERTISEAYFLNDPAIVIPVKADGGASAASLAGDVSFVSVDAANVVIETVKAAEDGVGVVVRCYESRRMRGKVRLRAAFPFSRAWKVNLLEENGEELAVTDDTVEFDVRPYEIVTILLK